MNKKMTIVIILALALLFLAIMSFVFLKPKSQNKVNNANLPEMSYGDRYFWQIPGIIFKYLDFNGWEVKAIEKNSNVKYTIYLNHPDTILFETAPKIIVEKISPVPAIKPKKNPNGVEYEYIKNPQAPDQIVFYGQAFPVAITPFLHEGEGYSDKILTDKIIESFKLVEEESITVKSGETTIFKDLSITNKGGGHKRLLKDSSDQTYEKSYADVVLKLGDKEQTVLFWDSSKDRNNVLMYDFEEMGKYTIFSEQVGFDGEYIKLLVKKQI